MKIKELTTDEAISILRDLMDDYAIDKGSSRAVYEYEYEGKHCVVKIACDREGHLQNEIECGLYEKCEYAENFLGTIYAKYKNYFHIMEYITPYGYLAEQMADGEVGSWVLEEDDEICNCRQEVVGTLHDEYGFKSYEAMMDAISDIRYVSNELYDWAGETSDNYQIGTNDEGKAKAYDYGYDTQYPCSRQVGAIESFCNPVIYILETLVDGLYIYRYEDEETCDNEETECE